MKMRTKAANFALLTLLSCAGNAQAADYNLRFSHIMPSTSGTAVALETWGRSLEEASNGRIAVEIYPSQTLTKAAQSYDAVKSRIADVAMVVQGYSANRFPLTQIVELPGIAASGVQGSCVVQSLYDEGKISSEYEDTHVLFMFTHGPGHIHTREKSIKTPEDLNGLKIRRPTTVVADLLEELGAQPVGIPAPETNQSLQRGVIDGLSMPWQGVKSFRLNEEATHHTEIGLYTLSFLITMNKDVYASMPGDLQQVIDAHSGMEWALKLGAELDNEDMQGRDEALAPGHEIITLEGGVDNPAWKAVFDTTTKKYLADLESRGLPAQDVYQRVRELSQSCNT